MRSQPWLDSVSLNPLTLPQISASRHMLRFLPLNGRAAAYVLCFLFWSGCSVPADGKTHRRECVLSVVYVYVVQHVGAFRASSPTSHEHRLSFVVGFYELSSTKFSAWYRKPQHLQELSCLILWSWSILSSACVQIHHHKCTQYIGLCLLTLCFHAPGVPVWKQCRGKAGSVRGGHQAGLQRCGQGGCVGSQRAGGLPSAAVPTVEAATTPGSRPHRLLLLLSARQRRHLRVC